MHHLVGLLGLTSIVLALGQADVVQSSAIQRAIAVEVGARPAGSREGADLHRFYDASASQPRWLDAARPSARARSALAILADAEDDGLDPEAYGAATLTALANDLTTASPVERLARFDVELTLGFLRYLRHLHLGRIPPTSLGFRVTLPADDHDFAAILLDAMASSALDSTIDSLRPRFSQYAQLRDQLTRYRAIAADSALTACAPGTTTLKPGEAAPRLDLLVRCLIAFGDLTPGTYDGVTTYEGALVDAVRRFQLRHGLEPDGVVGPATRRALEVPQALRVRQIVLALERLRWLPHPPSDRVIVVNIPMFRLWAGEAGAPVPVLDTGVIVGRALNTQTPVFDALLTHVIFRPYWNVPASILRNELLPTIRRDPGYVHRQEYQIVRGPGDDADVLPVTADSIDALGRGTARLRQAPGSINALGLVKFVFPNASDVYLHDTPGRGLFARPRRDFSHGCVRVENPIALAEWALSDDPAWNREAIAAAMESGPPSRRVDLARPITVLLFYLTAMVMPDGRMQFAEDIYRHDARLEAALARDGPGRASITRRP